MSTGRPLRDDERAIVAVLLRSAHSHPDLLNGPTTDTVEDMQDGGMGSIRFISPVECRHLGEAIAKAEYTDADGILVSIVLNADTCGRLYELDFWKVDFSPLRQYPLPSDLRIK